MKVFKFGGASVKDAEAVKNVKDILSGFPGESLCVVISAMGKTTNALEKVADSWINNLPETSSLIDQIQDYHNKIAADLLDVQSRPLDELFNELRSIAASTPPSSYDAAYDMVVSFGELLSTALVSAYLHEQGIANSLLDARKLVITDESHRNGRIKWEETGRRILEAFSTENPVLNKPITITQGFIGSSITGLPVTLGREGSDFSAAIFAHVLDASEMIIWKDVPGVLNADPQVFQRHG